MIENYLKNLYKVQKKDLEKCSVSLTDSFSKDEAMRSFLCSEEFDKDRMQALFKFVVRASLKHGHVYATSVNMEGVIIWFPENITYLSTFDFFTSGGLSIILKYGFKMPEKMMKYEKFTAKRHHENIKEPHWYLFSFGVAEKHRKKGFAGKLIRPFLKYFDEQGIPCYLETGKGNNEAMYRHYGFDLIEKIEMPDTGSVFKAMIRHPKKQ